MQIVEPEKEEGDYAPAIETAEDPTPEYAAHASQPVPSSEPLYAVPEAQVRAEVTAKLQAERALQVARFTAATGVTLQELRKERTLLGTISTMIVVGDKGLNNKKKRFQERVETELKDQQNEIERGVAKRMNRTVPEEIAVTAVLRDRRWLRKMKKTLTTRMEN